MKLNTTLAGIVLATAGAAASAQSITSTDEARALAAKQTAEQVRAELFRAPQTEAVAPGDVRAAAANATRALVYRQTAEAVLAYAAGQREAAQPVRSETGARAEAHRQTVNAELAREVAVLRSSAQARHEVEQVLHRAVTL